MARLRYSPLFVLKVERFLERYGPKLILITLAIVSVIVLHYNWPRRMHRRYVNVEAWMENPTVGCQKNFEAFGEEFARLRYVKFDKKTKRFAIPCKGKVPKYDFLYDREPNEVNPLRDWLRDLKTMSPNAVTNYKIEKNPAVVVMRREAHNLFHTLCEWYNVFLLSVLLRFDPRTVDILLVDDRPPSPLDTTWDVLFGKILKYSEVPDDVIYETLIWNINGYESPAHFHWQYELPYADEFYRFFIKAYDMPMKSLNCSNITVRVIFRRDYMSHPERTKIAGGLIQRKFENEDEIMSLVKSYLPPSADVKFVLLETLTMYEQVEMFTNTDMLIGMHGAGMSHAMFLPPHAVVFEMFPRYWGQLKHFRAFSRWRGLRYYAWKNINYRNERAGYYTYIPPLIFKLFMPKLRDYLCPSAIQE